MILDGRTSWVIQRRKPRASGDDPGIKTTIDTVTK